MNSTQYLEWPFFESNHRRLKEEITAWISTHQSLVDAHGQDIAKTTRGLAIALGKAGWLRYLTPAVHGGALPAIDVRSLCLIREALAFHSGVADCAFAIQGLGSAPITLFGDAALQRRYLPGMITGQSLGAFALSEPAVGSDVANLTTTAHQVGDGYVINGVKTWISNAGIADHYIVFARTAATGGAKGLAAFVVDANNPGLAVTEQLDIIAPHVIGTVEFKNCRVDAAALLGGTGDGFKIAMSTLDIFRATVGAAALGFARRALHETIARVGQREVFGQKLAQYQATQMRVADMALEIDAAALLVYRAAWTKDTQERRVTSESAMAKLYSTEAAQRVIDSAVQLFGGLGVTVGNVVERLYRDIRPLRIYEGTSEIQKIIIAAQVLGRS